MIKFFRKTRKRLIRKGKTRKYLKYAIGEIFLVVVGILIALQINNWNESRKKTETEVFYLKAIQDEFSKNLKEVEAVMKRNAKNLKTAHSLLNLMGQNDLILSEKTFDSLLYGSFISEIEYRPSSGVLTELVNSGKLGLISNRDLRLQLASWDGLITKVRFQEGEHAKPRYALIDIMNNLGNGRKSYINAYGNDFDIPNSRKAESSIILLENLEFDNQLSLFYLTGSYLNSQYYSKLKDGISDLLEALKTEIEK